MFAAAISASGGYAQDMSGGMGSAMQMPMPSPTQDLENAVRSVNDRRSNDANARARLEQRAAVRREQARVQAEALSSATPPATVTAASIRDALEGDLKAWRSEFGVGRREWQAMRDRWLVAETSLTASQWAAHRLAWFVARDAWITERGLGG